MQLALDVLVSRVPVVSYHFMLPVIFGIVYGGFSMVGLSPGPWVAPDGGCTHIMGLDGHRTLGGPSLWSLDEHRMLDGGLQLPNAWWLHFLGCDPGQLSIPHSQLLRLRVNGHD